MDWLKSIAPTIATVLGGPLAGMAVEAVGSALGMSDATKDKVTEALQSGNLTGDQIASIKQADQALRIRMRELDIELEKVDAGDRDSARKLVIEAKEKTPAVLSWLVVTAALGLEGWVMIYGLPAGADAIVLGRILGTLDAAFMTVLTFWLGTSNSSRRKDETINQFTKVK